MEKNGQLHALVALPPGDSAPHIHENIGSVSPKAGVFSDKRKNVVPMGDEPRFTSLALT
jgi:hypothetical protein